MQTADHARILFAYIARLTPADREEIAQRLKDWDHASLNLPTTSQIAAQQRVNEACERAVEHFCAHDRTLLAKLVADVAD